MWETAALLGASALGSALSSKLGHKGKMKQYPTMSPGQIADSDWARSTGRNQINNPYQGFEPIAKRAQSQFEQQTLPSLAERFSSFGSGNALSSPAFHAQNTAAGQDLSEMLASMMAQYGLQQQQMGQGLMGMGMRPQFENVYQPSSPSFLSNLFSGVSRGTGAMAGANMQQQAGGYDDNALNRIATMLASQAGTQQDGSFMLPQGMNWNDVSSRRYNANY